jgi:hypothetical protein
MCQVTGGCSIRFHSRDILDQYLGVYITHYILQCSAVQCSAVQCSAGRCSAVQCSAVQCSAVQCSAVQCSAVQCSAVQCSAVQCSAVQCSSLKLDGRLSGDWRSSRSIWIFPFYRRLHSFSLVRARSGRNLPSSCGGLRACVVLVNTGCADQDGWLHSSSS